MRYYLVIIFLSLSFKSLVAQQVFENDKDFSPFLHNAYKKIDSTFNLDKKVDFEYRIWVVPALRPTYFLFVVTQKENQWNFRWFEYGRSFTDSTSARLIKEKETPGKDINQLIKKFEENQYLAIPRADKVKDSTGQVADLAVLDGISYCFELISKKNKRFYFYHCPGYHEKEYPYVITFEQVMNIIRALLRYCGLGDTYICALQSKMTNC